MKELELSEALICEYQEIYNKQSGEKFIVGKKIKKQFEYNPSCLKTSDSINNILGIREFLPISLSNCLSVLRHLKRSG